MNKIILLLFILILILFPVASVALDARVETTDGEVFTIKELSMEGRQRFSVDYKGEIAKIDWKDIVSFEIKEVGSNFWIEIQWVDGKKEILRIRQMSPFRGRSESGKWSIPFEKVKKVFFIGDKKEDNSIKESSITSYSTPKEVDRITMRNGDILLGKILNDVVSIRTVYGTIYFQKETIHRIILGNPSAKVQKDREQDILYSKYGDKLTGLISDFQIRISLLTETKLLLSREHVKEIEFGVSPEFEQKSSPEHKDQS